MKYLVIFHRSACFFRLPQFSGQRSLAIHTPSELFSCTKAGTALRCASALSPPSPNDFPRASDIAHVTMRPIYSLDTGENLCRLSLLELSYVKMGYSESSLFLRRKFKFEIPTVFKRNSSTGSTSTVVTVDLANLLHQRRDYSRGKGQSIRIIMAILSYRYLIAFYATEYMQRSRFSCGKSTVQGTTVPSVL